ncbi:MAG: hypothetical protein ABI651_07235 [Verrucomicrobiota bacterium]
MKLTKRELLLALALGLTFAAIFFQYRLLKLRLAFAEEQIAIFFESRSSALKAADTTQAVSFLEYASEYYPSGTKQSPGSRLDRIVETVRSNCVQDIITDLKRRTGKDLGSAPTNWYKEFPPARP